MTRVSDDPSSENRMTKRGLWNPIDKELGLPVCLGMLGDMSDCLLEDSKFLRISVKRSSLSVKRYIFELSRGRLIFV
jgi:hypothetical protein